MGPRPPSPTGCWWSIPGPWGERALHHARLPEGLGRTLLRRERELRIRVLLIRRHGRAAGGAPACFAIHTGPDRPWMERADLDDVRDVAALDLDALGRGRSVGLPPRRRPRCSRSARTADAIPCCAERGRPLASALSHGVPGTDVGVHAHRRRSVRRQHDRVPARVLLRPGRPAPGVEIGAALPRRRRSTWSISGTLLSPRSTCRRRSTTCDGRTISPGSMTSSSTMSSGWTRTRS